MTKPDAMELARAVIAKSEYNCFDIDDRTMTLARAVLELADENDATKVAAARLQDDLLQRDETLALVERNRPVEAFFTLAKVMRECRDANARAAQAERDHAAQLTRIRAALSEACDIAEHLADLKRADHTAALVKVDELRQLAEEKP